jgi:hypothetical protein
MKNLTNIKLNLLMENLYIESAVNRIFEESSNFGKEQITESKKFGKSVLEDIVNDLNLSKKFIFTFGTGIGAFMGPVKELLEGSGLHFSEYEITLLIITAIASMLNDSDFGKLKEKIKEEGLLPYLNGVVKFISDSKDLISKILIKVTGSAYTLSDILGFTFLLVPAMNIISELINDYGITLNSVGQLFVGLGAASLTYGVKSVIDKIRNRL